MFIDARETQKGSKGKCLMVNSGRYPNTGLLLVL